MVLAKEPRFDRPQWETHHMSAFHGSGRIGVFLFLLFLCGGLGVLNQAQASPAPTPENPVLDLRPYAESEPALTEAFNLLSQKKYKAAQARFSSYLKTATDEEVIPAIQLLLAGIAEKRKDRSAVIKWLNAAAQSPALRSTAMIRLGRVLLKAGKWSDCEKALAQVEPTSPHYVEARRLRAGALRSLKRYSEARDDATIVRRTVLQDKDRDRATLLLADIAMDEKDFPAARMLLMELWWSRSKLSSKVEERLSKTGSTPSRVERLVRDVDALGRYSAGRRKKELRKRLKSFKGKKFAPLRDFVEASIRMNLRKERESAPALMDKALSTLKADDTLRPWFMLGMALSLRRDNLDLQSADAYARLVEAFPEHLLMSRALLGAGTLYVANGMPLAGELYLRALVERFPDAEEHDDALWELGWSAYLSGEYEKASELWTTLGEKYPMRRERSRSTWKEKTLYWRGRSALRRGRHKEALVHFSSVASQYPMSYYGLQARSWLDELGSSPEGMERRILPDPIEAVERPLLAGTFPKESSLLSAAVLIRLGLYEEAEQELRGQLERGNLSGEGLWLLLGLLQEMNKPETAQRLLRRQVRLAAVPKDNQLSFWHAAFPVQYEELVGQHAVESGVLSSLIFGIIHHESHFNPKTVSYANAVGLMQVLPSVATVISTRLFDEERIRKRDLKKPEVNIRMGSKLLRELLTMYPDNPVLAVSGYNAGAFAVKRWLARFGHLETDEWLEMIPYKGTSSYAKRVLTSMAVYWNAYGGVEGESMLTIPFQLPDKLGPYMEKPVPPTGTSPSGKTGS